LLLDFLFIFAIELFRVSALRGLAVDCSGLEVDFAVDFYVENSQLTMVCSDDVNFAGVSQILNGFAQVIGPCAAAACAESAENGQFSGSWECHGLGRDNKNAVTDYLLAGYEVARRHGV
jgi:hypothetical protein